MLALLDFDLDGVHSAAVEFVDLHLVDLDDHSTSRRADS